MRSQIRAILSSFQWNYEIVLAPFLAKKGRVLLFPFYFFLKKFNICFVVNIISTTGHIVVELDHFLRARLLGDIDPKKRYVWLKKKDPYSSACISLYRHYFWHCSLNRIAYLFFLPLTMAFPDIVFDAGISRLKWQLPKLRKYREFEKGSSYLHQISKPQGLQRTLNYYKKIAKAPTTFPLKNANFNKDLLRNFFSLKGDKLALIHIKDVARNAIATPTDPKTYRKTLEHLKDLHFDLLFIGREKMPDCFKEYGIKNYAESKIASFYHDLCLFSLADLSVITASGVSVLADCMNVPYLYLNSWQLPVCPFSKKSIFIPALVENKNGKKVPFSEQNLLYKSLIDLGAEIFPSNEYNARNASEEEIFMAVKELLELEGNLKTPLTSLQKQYKCLDPDAPLFYAQARCSQFFLEKHKDLLTGIVEVVQ